MFRYEEYLRHCILFLIFILCGRVEAKTALDPLIGMRVSLLASQTLLGTPPLPSMRYDRSHVTIQGSYLSVSAKEQQNATANSEDFTEIHYNGVFKGGALGLGYTSKAANGVGYFVFGVANYLSGDLDIYSPGSSSASGHLKDMKNLGASMAAGLNWSIWNSSKIVPMSLGFLLGPTASYFNSTFHITTDSANTNYNYETHPTLIGGLVGLQSGMSLGDIFINPYALYYSDSSDHCKPYDTDNPTDAGGDPTSSCGNRGRFVELNGSFSAYGVNLSFKRLTLNVYSYVPKSSAMSSLDITSYQLVYSFNY